ncbi:MAG: AbrB/MazE/SpoVT family DNA-binding domain-containing protein [Nitrosotalea sp.]
MVETIVTVTKKGQATIPKELRKKHKITKKALAVDTKEGVLFKALAGPLAEKGSLKELFRGKTSRQLVKEARSEEIKKEKRLERRTGGR